MKRRRHARAPASLRALASAAAVSISASFAVSPARADPQTKACVAAFDAEQRLTDTGDLLGARAKLFVCGAASCPAAVQRECIDSLSALEPRIPTLTLAAVDGAGHDRVDVKVAIDGAPVADRIDGRELPVNPGPHVLRFSAPGRPPVEVSIVAREREKGRIVRAVIGGGEAPTTDARTHDASTPAPSSVPALSYGLGAAGVLALGAFAYFGLRGLSARSDLDACSPFCSDAQRDDARAKLRDADIALGGAVVLIGAAVVIYLLHPGDASHHPVDAGARDLTVRF